MIINYFMSEAREKKTMEHRNGIRDRIHVYVVHRYNKRVNTRVYGNTGVTLSYVFISNVFHSPVYEAIIQMESDA